MNYCGAFGTPVTVRDTFLTEFWDPLLERAYPPIGYTFDPKCPLWSDCGPLELWTACAGLLCARSRARFVHSMLQLVQSRGDHPRQDDLADDDEHDGEDQRQREAADRRFRHESG